MGYAGDFGTVPFGGKDKQNVQVILRQFLTWNADNFKNIGGNVNKKILDSAIKYIEDIFQNNADGHDTEHSIRVYRNSMDISKNYPDCDIMIVSLSALLHDVDDHKLFNTENNSNARHFLESQHLEQRKIEQICNIINEVSFSRNRGKSPKSIEGKIVQDADRLDAIGAIGIARVFAFGGKSGRTIEKSLQHFQDKLLLLKDEMNTQEAKDIADERHSFMETFLKEIDKEIKR